jgi:hypothetical protein
MFVCLFSWRYNRLWLYFHSPVAGFSLLVFRGFLITHYDAPQSVGLLWTSDQSVAETSTWQHTTLNNRHTSMPAVGFEPTISAGERPKTYALDRAAWDRHRHITNKRSNSAHPFHLYYRSLNWDQPPYLSYHSARLTWNILKDSLCTAQ